MNEKYMTHLCLCGPHDGEFNYNQGERFEVALPEGHPLRATRGDAEVINGSIMLPPADVRMYTKMFFSGLGFWVFQDSTAEQVLLALCNHLQNNKPVYARNGE